MVARSEVIVMGAGAGWCCEIAIQYVILGAAACTTVPHLIDHPRRSMARIEYALDCSRQRARRNILPVQRIVIIAAFVMLAVLGVLGQQPPQPRKVHHLCKNNPELVGQCFTIHGRAFNSNGTPDLRIWHLRTKRILGVTASETADDAEEPIAPQNLLHALDEPLLCWYTRNLPPLHRDSCTFSLSKVFAEDSFSSRASGQPALAS